MLWKHLTAQIIGSLVNFHQSNILTALQQHFKTAFCLPCSRQTAVCVQLRPLGTAWCPNERVAKISTLQLFGLFGTLLTVGNANNCVPCHKKLELYRSVVMGLLKQLKLSQLVSAAVSAELIKQHHLAFIRYNSPVRCSSLQQLFHESYLQNLCF